MRLYLLRHGIAIGHDDPECPADPERFLTELGQERTAAAVDGIRALGVSVDRIISSPFVRAFETAKIAKAGLGFGAEIELNPSLIWSVPGQKICRELEDARDGAIMLVGHAPHLDNVVGHLVGSAVSVHSVTNMKKASLVELDCSKTTAGSAILLGYYPPRVLRALGQHS